MTIGTSRRLLFEYNAHSSLFAKHKFIPAKDSLKYSDLGLEPHSVLIMTGVADTFFRLDLTRASATSILPQAVGVMIHVRVLPTGPAKGPQGLRRYASDLYRWYVSHTYGCHVHIGPASDALHL